jgi:predicted amidophosphoribosyltransferase
MKTTKVLELEGTWEEILAHADQLAGRKVRLIVLSSQPSSTTSEQGYSTAESLLKYAGTWEGDDFEECLQLVYDTRG